MSKRLPGRPSGLLVHTEALEALLGSKNWLKRDLADNADISAQFVSDLLAHRGGASPKVADRIASAMGVKPEALFPELVGWAAPLPERSKSRTVAA